MYCLCRAPLNTRQGSVYIGLWARGLSYAQCLGIICNLLFSQQNRSVCIVLIIVKLAVK